jgi:tetratricopeptide (TPR) repeat protein
MIWTAKAEGQSSDTQMFQQAMRSMQDGDMGRAEALFTALRSRHPHTFAIDESLGLLYAKEGRISEAIGPLAEAVRDNPQSSVARANLGTAYLKDGKVTEAARELHLAAEQNPGDAATQVALGQADMLLHRPVEAAAAFEAALPKDSRNAALLYNTALAYFDAHEAAKAEPLLARMPGVDESAEAQELYGDVDESLGKYESAGKHYAAAARMKPSEPNVYMLGIEFLRHWTFGPAAKVFAAGVKEYPDSTRMHVGLGVAYYGGGKYNEAIPVFAKLLDAHPDNKMYAELLGRNCTVLTEGMQPECEKLVSFSERHPHNAELATYTAISILHRPYDPKGLTMARTLLTNAIAAQPKLARAHFAMGLLLQNEQKWKDSIPELQRAIELKPDYAAAHYRLALAYSHEGEHDRAQKEIALDQKYSKEQDAKTNARLQKVTTFLVSMK